MGVGCGGSDDYIKSKRAKYVYTVEIVGGGTQGFDLPEAEMMPAILESCEGILAMANYLTEEKTAVGSRALLRASVEKPEDLVRSYIRGQKRPYATRTQLE